MNKKSLTLIAATAGACLITAVVSPRLARSADHLDSPATVADATADINDVFAFTDGSDVVFAMTVFPAAPSNAKFSDKIAYVFHTASAATFGSTSNDANIICKFDAAQKISCWGGGEYVTGDANVAAGIASTNGKLKVFAGLRQDPFFFNLDGFKSAVTAVKSAGSLQLDVAGCPNLDSSQSAALRNLLQKTNGGNAVDFFKTLNTLAIVVAIDKTLVTKGGKLVTVWASTNKTQ